jgi:FHS family L-fucose permease-like MFS transporter
MVRMPYLIITGIFLFVALLIYVSDLPEIREGTNEDVPASRATLSGVWGYGHLVKGVIAQFFYVGAQVGVASFIIRFAEHAIPGTHEKMAAHYLQMHLLGFMIGRFAGSAVMKKMPAPRLLGLFAGSAVICKVIAVLATGRAPVWAIVLAGFFHSIMFPTIFALSLKHLGPYTKLGSSLLVMSIIGGAICPAIMGRISDALDIQKAFVIPLICHAYVFYFALRGYRPTVTQAAPALGVAASEAE